jgi:alpha-1,2-mannosyltransferase
MTTPERWVQSLRVFAGPLAAMAAIVVVFLPLSPSYDLDVFLRAGHSLLHGLPVYPQPGSRAVYSGFSFVYPFFAALPFVPLAAIPAHTATFIFFALSVAAVLAACLLATNGDPVRATLIFCTTFMITGLQLGALSPLLFAGAVMMWRLRERPRAMALLAAPVLASKLFLAPLLAWPLLARRYRAFAYACTLIAALLALSFVFGPLGPVSYTQILSALGLHEARAGFGLIGALMNLGLGASLAQVCAAVLAVGVLATARRVYKRSGNEAILFCAGIVASLLVSPVLWSHYLVLLPAGLIALGAPRRAFVVLALASWAIAPPHGVALDSDLIEGFKNSGAWLAVAVSLMVFGTASIVQRRNTSQTGYG